MNPTLRRAGLWLLVPVLLFGMFIGLLLTWHHDTELFGGGDGELIGCTESAEVSCNVVNTSAWSELLGVPIATWSFASHATVLVLVLLALRGRDSARALVVVAGVLAVAGSAWLFYVSKVELGFVCAWCLRLYAVNVAILVFGLFEGMPAWPERRMVFTGASIYAVLTGLSVGAERAYRATLLGSERVALVEASEERPGDPEGDAPPLTITVRTEDGNEATLTLNPGDAWKGNPDATVAVVEFADLECPYCKRMANEMARLEATYGDRVLFVFKHFPMDPACNPGVKNRLHPYACVAAKAAVCAREQRVFWRFHDLAFKNQHELGLDALRAYAREAGADVAAFDACLASPLTEEIVRRDATAGQALDIHGTPRIYVDGTLYRSGSSAEVIARAIEQALGASAEEAAAKAAGLRETQAVAPPIPDDVPAMRIVSRGGLAFRIDTFEAAVVDGVAVSGKRQIPALQATWYEANEACAAAGKRLCSEEEWVTACQGARAVDDDDDGAFADDMIEGTAYPYGDHHTPGRCWDGREGEQFRPVYTGELPGCATADGVYDMTGNMEEWAGTSPETAVLLGGAWDTSKDHARCYRRNDRFGAGYATVRTGFRCCAP
jgi:protein-disulfide isomerase/uncharacterized membrane protein